MDSNGSGDHTMDARIHSDITSNAVISDISSSGSGSGSGSSSSSSSSGSSSSSSSSSSGSGSGSSSGSGSGNGSGSSEITIDGDNDDTAFPPSSSIVIGHEELDKEDEVEHAYVIFPPSTNSGGDRGGGDSGDDREVVDDRSMVGEGMIHIENDSNASRGGGDGMIIETTATSSSSILHITHNLEGFIGGDNDVGGDVGVGGDVSVGGASKRVATEVEIDGAREVESVIVITSSASTSSFSSSSSSTTTATTSTIADTPTHAINTDDTHYQPTSSSQSAMTLNPNSEGIGASGGTSGGSSGGGVDGGDAGGGLSFSGVLAAGTRLEEELTRLKVELSASLSSLLTYSLRLIEHVLELTILSVDHIPFQR